MNRLWPLLALLISIEAFAGWKQEARRTLKENSLACKSVEVKIDSIVKNETIKGHVVGLPAEALDDFKMFFYVKTNAWYVHPFQYYPGQQEGYSYSNLNHRGEFQVKTVLRDIPSKELAAVLVPKSVKIRNVRLWLNPIIGIGGLTKYNCGYTRVPGNGDF